MATIRNYVNYLSLCFQAIMCTSFSSLIAAQEYYTTEPVFTLTNPHIATVPKSFAEDLIDLTVMPFVRRVGGSCSKPCTPPPLNGQYGRVSQFGGRQVCSGRFVRSTRPEY